ncbi:hypothetical protein L2755_21860 [Shewanella abyssi]|uniref:hypothetical protein n=1 Tax=Shewanella abyssi TaxID=311789 RepID=UPI00200C10FB|nr:hypothetical protein [Shewanella abyssi]MCL1052235.1 hypothetical protein [Shewanella abyssi]
MIRNILIVVFVYLFSFSINNVNPYSISFSIGSPAYAGEECFGGDLCVEAPPRPEDSYFPCSSCSSSGGSGSGSGSGGTITPQEQCVIDSAETQASCKTIAGALHATSAALCVGFGPTPAFGVCEVASYTAYQDALGNCDVTHTEDVAMCN